MANSITSPMSSSARMSVWSDDSCMGQRPSIAQAMRFRRGDPIVQACTKNERLMRAEPSSDRIDVWSWRLGASEAQLARLIRLLSRDELARAKRLAFAEHR